MLCFESLLSFRQVVGSLVFIIGQGRRSDQSLLRADKNLDQNGKKTSSFFFLLGPPCWDGDQEKPDNLPHLLVLEATICNSGPDAIYNLPVPYQKINLPTL